MNRVKIGAALFVVAIILFLTGTFIQTPTEHAKRIVYGFLDSVEESDIDGAVTYLHEDVILKDSWNGKAQNGRKGARLSLEELYRRHILQYNTILKMHIIEKATEVQK